MREPSQEELDELESILEKIEPGWVLVLERVAIYYDPKYAPAGRMSRKIVLTAKLHRTTHGDRFLSLTFKGPKTWRIGQGRKLHRIFSMSLNRDGVFTVTSYEKPPVKYEVMEIIEPD